jgi:hypothetical protein
MQKGSSPPHSHNLGRELDRTYPGRHVVRGVSHAIGGKWEECSTIKKIVRGRAHMQASTTGKKTIKKPALLIQGFAVDVHC